MRYFEDIEIGNEMTAGPYEVTADEIVTFAKKWDPMPFHIDPEAAKKSHFGGLVASGSHTIAIYYALLQDLRRRAVEPFAALAVLKLEIEFTGPVRAGDKISISSTPLEKRESKSNNKVGIAKMQVALTNQDGAKVLALVATGMFARRPTAPVA